MTVNLPSVGKDRLGDTEEEIRSLLLGRELVDQFIFRLVPAIEVPSSRRLSVSSTDSIFFSSRITNLFTALLFHYDLAHRAASLITRVGKSIREVVSKWHFDPFNTSALFWLTNVHEMLSFIHHIEDDHNGHKHVNESYKVQLKVITCELEKLELDMFSSWIGHVEENHRVPIATYVLNNRQLPSQSSTCRFSSHGLSTVHIADPLETLATMYSLMSSLCIEGETFAQTVRILLNSVEVLVNDVLQNNLHSFSLNTCLQIDFNITRIRQWCVDHGIEAQALPFSSLWIMYKSAIRSMTKKSPPSYQLCEEDALALLSRRKWTNFKTSKGKETILFSVALTETRNGFVIAPMRAIDALRTTLPSGFDLPHISHFIDLVRKHAKSLSLNGKIGAEKSHNDKLRSTSSIKSSALSIPSDSSHCFTMRVCNVCDSTKPIPEFPLLIDCLHVPHTCEDCLREWTVSVLKEESWKLVRCPEKDCNATMQHVEVQQHVDTEQFRRYDELSFQDALTKDPNFRWCSQPKCDSGQIHESGVDGNIFTCASCSFKSCILHDSPWHEGETCEDYDYRKSGKKARDQKVQESKSEKMLETMTKKCPGLNGTCGWRIEKNGGCDHMRCIKCKYEFCWVCTASYDQIRSEGNTAHSLKCRHHTVQIARRA